MLQGHVQFKKYIQYIFGKGDEVLRSEKLWSGNSMYLSEKERGFRKKKTMEKHYPDLTPHFRETECREGFLQSPSAY